MTDRLEGADESLADVIPLVGRMPQDFANAKAELPVVRDTRVSAETCRHKFSVLDVPARRIHCRDCNVELDPIDVLDDIARRHESITSLLHARRRDLDYTLGELHEAERKEKNAKARLRAVRKRARELEASGVELTPEERHEILGEPLPRLFRAGESIR